MNFLNFDSNQKHAEEEDDEETFVECEGHVWPVGPRRLPVGIRHGRGEAAFCLHRDLVDYVLKSSDVYVNELKVFYKNVFNPIEVCFYFDTK